MAGAAGLVWFVLIGFSFGALDELAVRALTGLRFRVYNRANARKFYLHDER